jgi:subtilisin-like proprotein convertase family protein
VDNLNGNVTKVRVELRGFEHGYPDDLDLVLVSPSGHKVMLMSDAGGSVGVTNINLVFDQAAGSDIPDASVLASGTFRPANHDITTDPFPSTASGSPYTAPASPFATSLDSFNGTNPKGTWQLFAVDDTRQDGGRIAEWNLYVATGPRISGLADVGSLPEDRGFTVPFQVLDEDFATGPVSFGFSSTNPAVVAVTGLSVEAQRDSNYLLSGTPVLNASGATRITVFATNSFGQVASGSFNVAFTPVNDAPEISPTSGSLLLTSGESGQFGFNYNDVETPQKDLVLTITSSNPQLVPNSNIFLFDTNLVIAPVGNLTGRADVTVTVRDAAGLEAMATYNVVVEPALHAQFANTNTIVLPTSGPATTQYPSTINVSGVRGKVSKVTVTLAQVFHNYPADLDVLLVSPGADGVSKKVVLLSDAAGGRALNPSRLTLDDAAPARVPYNPATAVAPGSYKPTNEEGTSDVFAGAPAGPYTYELSSLAGIEPNGEWRLFVVDDVAPDAGRIDGGWILNIFTTEPSIGEIVDQVTPEATPITVPFRIADPDTALTSLRIDVTTDRPSLLDIGPVTVRTPTPQDPFNNRQVVITPVGFNNGEATVTIDVTDNTPSTATTSFRVVVTPVNQAPALTGLVDASTPANRTLTVPFAVADNETPASDLVITATLDRPSFGTVEVTTGGANRALIFRPAGEKGVTAVTVVATDGELSVTEQLLITVSDPYTLTVTPIADQTVAENGTKTVPFTVLGSETGNVTAVAVVETDGVLSGARVEGSGTSWVLFLTAAPGANGSTLITVTANDEFGGGSTTFTASIIPVDDPPSIAPIADVATFANINAIVRTTVADPDTALSSLEFTWASSNPTLVRSVLFALNGDTLIATVIPNRDELGQASLTLFVSDGTTKVGRPFLLTVSERPNEAPTLDPVADQETFANIPAFVRLTITDPDTAITDLQITGSAANTDLIQSVIPAIGSDGSVILNIRPKRDQVGQSAILVSVNDGKTTVNRSFILTVKTVPNEAPVIAEVADQTTDVNTPLVVELTVTDPDTALADLIVSGDVSNSAVLRPVQASNDGTTIRVRLVPVTDATGVSAVTVTIDDGANKVTRSFAVTVKTAAAPEVAIPVLTVAPDGTRSITVTWENGSADAPAEPADPSSAALADSLFLAKRQRSFKAHGMINVAVIGLGFMGVTHIKAYRKVPGRAWRRSAMRSNCRPTASRQRAGNVADPDPVGLDLTQVQATKDFREVLANPGDPGGRHLPPDGAARGSGHGGLAAGKHVVCEKPLARTSAASAGDRCRGEDGQGLLHAGHVHAILAGLVLAEGGDRGRRYGKVLAARFRRVSGPPGWSKGTYFKGAIRAARCSTCTFTTPISCSSSLVGRSACTRAG